MDCQCSKCVKMRFSYRIALKYFPSFSMIQLRVSVTHNPTCAHPHFSEKLFWKKILTNFRITQHQLNWTLTKHHNKINRSIIYIHSFVFLGNHKFLCRIQQTDTTYKELLHWFVIMDNLKCIFLSILLRPIDGIYINELLEGPCTVNDMFYHADSDKMISSLCNTAIDIDCDTNYNHIIDGVKYYNRELSRNESLCGSEKLNKEYITSSDIETQLTSTDVIIESNENIEIKHKILSTTSNKLSIISNLSIIISSNIENNGDILLQVILCHFCFVCIPFIT